MDKAKIRCEKPTLSWLTLGVIGVVLAIAFLIFLCTLDGKTPASAQVDTSVKDVGTQGHRSLISNLPDAATLGFGESELAELRNVFASYETKLKMIEFRNSILRWEGHSADKVARLYELRPLSKEDSQQIDKSIDEVLADQGAFSFPLK